MVAKILLCIYLFMVEVSNVALLTLLLVMVGLYTMDGTTTLVQLREWFQQACSNLRQTISAAHTNNQDQTTQTPNHGPAF